MTVDLKARREELGLTQDEVAEKVGVASTTIGRWESGEIDNMRRDKIKKIAEVLQLSPLDLIGVEDTEMTPARRVLLKSLEGASEEDIMKAIKIIEVLRK